MKSFCFAAMFAAVQAAEGSFNYDQMGADWASVNALCGSGKEQSPIDLPSKGADSLASNEYLKIIGDGYANYATQSINYGTHTLKVTADLGNYFYTDQDDKTFPFNLAQFHMHAPSEHTVDGKNYDLEMHFVHLVNQSEATDYSGVADFAVIGVFFDRVAGGNTDNSFIASLNASSTTKDNTNVNISNVQVADFLGGLDLEDGYWTYNGSFTTPPCTEGVKWVVVNQVQPISDAQLQQYTKRWAGNSAYADGNGNNRIIMPLNDRTLYFSGAAALQMAAGALLIATQLF